MSERARNHGKSSQNLVRSLSAVSSILHPLHSLWTWPISGKINGEIIAGWISFSGDPKSYYQSGLLPTEVLGTLSKLTQWPKGAGQQANIHSEGLKAT